MSWRWQYVEDVVARKPRRDQRQGLTFKTMPPVTYCFQLGSVSRTFYSPLTVSSSYDSVYGLMHSWRQSSQSSVSSQWLSLPIRKQVFSVWAFVEDASDENLSRIFAWPKLFFNIPSMGNPGQTFLWCPLAVVHPLAYYMDISSLLQARSCLESKTNKREMPKSWLAGSC